AVPCATERAPLLENLAPATITIATATIATTHTAGFQKFGTDGFDTTFLLIGNHFRGEPDSDTRQAHTTEARQCSEVRKVAKLCSVAASMECTEESCQCNLWVLKSVHCGLRVRPETRPVLPVHLWICVAKNWKHERGNRWKNCYWSRPP